MGTKQVITMAVVPVTTTNAEGSVRAGGGVGLERKT